jgi:phenylalanyl-tRNA synthetase beta chain
MQFSEQWLRRYADPTIGSEELAHRLTMAGLEVEEVVPVAPPVSAVVVAQVTSVAKHPNADKLTVCEVDAGQGRLLQIVCGAPNVAAGIRVPCALDGAVLPGDVHIKATKMRGVESQGMLCSARELGLSDDHSGLLLLAADAPLGEDIRRHLALDDQLFTVKLTPNRGDCLSLVGIAREVAAITGAPLALPQWAVVEATSTERLKVDVQAPDLCGRFSGRVIRGLDARATTPEWIKQRLERSGQRPISALVDISNYVMLELGRPSHVFDLDKVAGGLTVRWGQAGEQVELLNGQTVEIDAGVGVIADSRGVEALAGIMGGAATAVTLDTRHVYVEAAFWWPEAIQGRARRYNFSTDAAHRFERGVDYATTVEHLDYLTRLLVDICGTAETVVGPVDDHVVRLPERSPVELRLERCRKVLGLPLATEEIVAVFKRLGIACVQQEDRLRVTPPSYRFDLEIEEDLIEEVARLVGFERLPALPPRASAAMHARPETRRSPHALRRQLAALGYQELVNFSFVPQAWEQDFGGNAEPIRVLNPIASHLAVMRSTLIGGLVDILKYNLNRKAARVRLFEIGRVFHRSVEVSAGPLTVAGIAQPMRVGGLIYGPADDEQWSVAKREADFFDAKGDVERLLAGRTVVYVPAARPALHPGRSAQIEINGQVLGWLGELHPRWQQKYELPRPPMVFEVDFDVLLEEKLPQARAVSRVPAVQRDLALWIDENVIYQQVIDSIDALRASDSRLAMLRDVALFDVYQPPSSSVADTSDDKVLLQKDKSLALRLLLQHTDRTLEDADADAAVQAVSDHLAAQLGARLRR